MKRFKFQLFFYLQHYFPFVLPKMQFKITSLAVLFSLTTSVGVFAQESSRIHTSYYSSDAPGGYCNSATYKCSGNGYYSCVAQRWTWSPCGAGTTCHQSGDGVYCG